MVPVLESQSNFREIGIECITIFYTSILYYIVPSLVAVYYSEEFSIDFPSCKRQLCNNFVELFCCILLLLNLVNNFCISSELFSREHGVLRRL
jgi:hypothetical protein